MEGDNKSMNSIYCKNCGSVIEDSNKGHFCCKSCKKEYKRKKVLKWGCIAASIGLSGYGIYKGGPKIYNWGKTNLGSAKKMRSQNLPVQFQNNTKPRIAVLDKRDIVASLNNRGCDVKNVRALNPILEKMGVLKKVGTDWIVTDVGMQYSIYNAHTVNEATGFRSTLVDAVQKYLNKNGK